MLPPSLQTTKPRSLGLSERWGWCSSAAPWAPGYSGCFGEGAAAPGAGMCPAAGAVAAPPSPTAAMKCSYRGKGGKESEPARSSEETKEGSERRRVWDGAAGSSQGVAAFLPLCHRPPWYRLGAPTHLPASPNNERALVLSRAFPAVGTSFLCNTSFLIYCSLDGSPLQFCAPSQGHQICTSWVFGTYIPEVLKGAVLERAGGGGWGLNQSLAELSRNLRPASFRVERCKAAVCLKTSVLLQTGSEPHRKHSAVKDTGACCSGAADASAAMQAAIGKST